MDLTPKLVSSGDSRFCIGYGESFGGVESGSTSQTVRSWKYRRRSEETRLASDSRAQTTLDLSISAAL